MKRPPETLKAISAVRIVKDSLLGFCSGTHIGDGLVVTAAHCTDVVDKPQIYTSLGGKVDAATLLWANKTYDVALYYAPGLEKLAKSAEVSCRAGLQGEPIWSVNNPLGQLFLRQVGYVMEGDLLPSLPYSEGFGTPTIQVWEDHQLMFLPTGPGASGGPVYDRANRLMGVIVGQFNQQPTMMIYVSGPALCRVLGRTNG